MRVNQQDRNAGAKVEVLKTGAIPETKLGPVNVAGGTPGAEEFDQASGRETINVMDTAPVVGDATLRAKEIPEGAETMQIKRYRVVSPNGRNVNDPNGGGRVFLHEGKEILSSHYNIRALQQQGLRLLDITDLDENEPVS